MATVYITMRIMPDGPEADLNSLQEKAKKLIQEHGGNIAKVEETPVAFGLKAINITFSMDESKGSTDELEEKICSIDAVQSVQVTDVRRAIG